MAESGALFRKEVLDVRADRLHGTIILSQSVSSRVMTAALIMTMVAIGAWLVIGSYARIETARGILVPTSGATKVYALRAGIVTELHAYEGLVVAARQKLAIIKSDQPSGEGGRYTEEGVDSLGAQEQLATARIDAGGARGCCQRSNASITTMCPPQQGHGDRPSTGSIASSSSGGGAKSNS
jgi:membrane fusion protein